MYIRLSESTRKRRHETKELLHKDAGRMVRHPSCSERRGMQTLIFKEEFGSLGWHGTPKPNIQRPFFWARRDVSLQVMPDFDSSLFNLKPLI